MNDITKLPDKWRKRGRKNMAKIHYEYAEELESAMPTWTKITDDPDTWPEDRERVLATRKDVQFDVWHEPAHFIFRAEFYRGAVGTYWRPLCDLDYPPEETK